jgi:hypothetical protein
MTFSWATLTPCDPLAYVLPHHAAHMTASPLNDAPAYDSIKGMLTPIVGRSLTVRLPVVPAGFDAPRAVAPQYAAELRQQLHHDALEALPDLPDSYGFGKCT